MLGIIVIFMFVVLCAFVFGGPKSKEAMVEEIEKELQDCVNPKRVEV